MQFDYGPTSTPEPLRERFEHRMLDSRHAKQMLAIQQPVQAARCGTVHDQRARRHAAGLICCARLRERHDRARVAECEAWHRLAGQTLRKSFAEIQGLLMGDLRAGRQEATACS